jgi:hypothetical protein
MKHPLFFGIFILSVISLMNSCKKEYTCYCYFRTSSKTAPFIKNYHEQHVHIREKKHVAEGECKSYETSFRNNLILANQNIDEGSCNLK